MSEQQPPARPPLGADIADAVQREVEQVTESLRHELDRLRAEAAERARQAGRGAALVGAAGALGLVSGGALASLPFLALRRVVPGWLLALAVAGGSAAGAAVLARAGLEELAAAAPESVQERVEEAAANVTDTIRGREAYTRR